MSASGRTAGHLDVGGLFESTAEIYKAAFGTVWIVALILMIPAGIISGILGNGGLLGIIGFLVQAIAGVWLAGTIVRVVQDVEADGRVDASIGTLFGLVAPRLISLFVLSIVFSVCVGIGLIFIIIPGVIIALMWIVSTPAMVVENLGVFDALGRSSALTRHNRLRILAVGIALFVAYVIVSGVLVLIGSLVPILGIIVGILVAVLVYPYVSIIIAVLYYRLLDVKGEGPAAAGAGHAGAAEPPAPAV